jgi:2-oxoglutarate ferredoxin oxidoreductase subunit delta
MSEEYRFMFTIVVNAESCDGCGSCVDICPMEVLALINGKAAPRQPEVCMCCRMCEVECPNQAIRVLE